MSKSKTAVLYSYDDDHLSSRQNLEYFLTNGLVEDVDYFLAGSKIKLPKAAFEHSKFKEIYFDEADHRHQKIARFYHKHVHVVDSY